MALSTAISERAENARTPVVRIEHLSKTYHDPRHAAVDSFDLEVAAGEIVALLGPSGCGKTTLLRLIAGFEEPDEGSISIAGRTISGNGVWTPPERRRIGFVFQNYALFPHMDVLTNVAFGLSGMPASERTARAREVIDLVGLTIFSRRYPSQLSGGQQQRVALARALAPEPDVILLDEPFSNLDAALRGSTREEVRRILERTRTTTVLVTHDQEEAMSFSDRLAVMRAGRLEQEGLPEAVYLRPRTAFVASFLGRSNLVRGTAQGVTADTPLGFLEMERPMTGPVLLSLRPESLVFGDSGAEVEIVGRAFKGHDLTFVCALRNGSENVQVIVQTGPECPLRPGDRSRLRACAPAVPLQGS